MASYEVTLPDLGENAGNEATISFWHVDEGDSVEVGDDLVEMTTDKATFTIPSPVSGVVNEILAEEGDIVKVGEVMLIIEEQE